MLEVVDDHERKEFGAFIAFLQLLNSRLLLLHEFVDCLASDVLEDCLPDIFGLLALLGRRAAFGDVVYFVFLRAS